MTIRNYTNMDLFIFRRKEKNIKLPLLKSNKKVIKLGLIIGGSFLLLVLFFSSILTIQLIFNNLRKNRLKPFVEEYDKYVENINTLKSQVNIVEKKNSDLSKAIVSIRSGSSILSEISRLIPTQIALSTINVEENKLEIKGVVNQDLSLELINLFMIELVNSQFIKDESVKLVNAKKKNQANEGGLDKINFIITAEIIENTKNIDKKFLKSLGSIGIYKRVDIIQKKGLLK